MKTLFLGLRASRWFTTSLMALSVWANSTEAAERSVALTGDGLSKWRKPLGEWIEANDVALDAKDSAKFKVAPGKGIVLNGAAGRTTDLISQDDFGDVQVHVEFVIPAHSNSGVYLMGRYEVQIYDSYNVSNDKYPGIECGGIYPRWTNERGEYEGHSPRRNASQPPGQWQTFDITFRAPRFDKDGKKIAPATFLKVMHNGVTVHENVTVTGPTRSAHWEDEVSRGPLLLQGDHGPVAFRNLRVTPLEPAARE